MLTLAVLPITQSKAMVTDGIASYYADRFDGRRTASGDRFDKDALTAAHRTLSFGTKVLVTNKSNGRSVEVTINDRGPYVRGRTIDLSKGAARELGMIGHGTARVELQIVDASDTLAQPHPNLTSDDAQKIMMELF